jgi:uncharacterized HAD superfamily protein
MIIAVDIDDVLCDTAGDILEFYNKRYEPKVLQSDLNQYVYLGFLGETKEEAAKKLADYNNQHMCRFIKPYDGAVEGIEALAKKHTLMVVTSRPYYIKEDTLEWLNKYFPNKFSEVHFNNKDGVDRFLPQTGIPKSVFLEKIGAEVFIEDILKYVTDCPSHIKSFLLDRPWNQGQLPENAVRVSDWKEIIDIIG